MSYTIETRDDSDGKCAVRELYNSRNIGGRPVGRRGLDYVICITVDMYTCGIKGGKTRLMKPMCTTRTRGNTLIQKYDKRGGWGGGVVARIQTKRSAFEEFLFVC